MNTAAKVAQRKEKHPEMYCPVPRCLWRTNGERCPRHAIPPSPSVPLVEEENEVIQITNMEIE